MKKYDCNIIQDLLPNYIEKLTSENTNEYVEKHLLECEQCSNIHNKLKNVSDTDNAKNEQFVNYSKKFKFRFNLLKCVVILVFLIFIGNIIRNVVIIESLSAKGEKYKNSTNYYSLYQQYDENDYCVIETYHYGNKYYRTMRTIDKISGELFFAEQKCDGEKVIFYSKNADGDEGIQEIDNGGGIMPVEPRSCLLLEDDNDILTKIRNYILSDIESVTYNGIECYRFTNHCHTAFGVNDDIYINKENGLLVRRTSERLEDEYRDVQDVLFEFDTITEENINELIK